PGARVSAHDVRNVGDQHAVAISARCPADTRDDDARVGGWPWEPIERVVIAARGARWAVHPRTGARDGRPSIRPDNPAALDGTPGSASAANHRTDLQGRRQSPPP